MKKLVLLSGGVLCSTLLSFTVKDNKPIYASENLTIRDCGVSQENVSYILGEDLMMWGTPEKKSWSDTKSLNESVSKDSAKSLVSKKTKGEDCECSDSKPQDPKDDDKTIEQQTYALIQKYNI